MSRAIAVASIIAAYLFASMSVAQAPPLPPGTFHVNAHLDRSQVIDPGPCTVHTFRQDGWVWSYCEEDPENVQPVIP